MSATEGGEAIFRRQSSAASVGDRIGACVADISDHLPSATAEHHLGTGTARTVRTVRMNARAAAPPYAHRARLWRFPDVLNFEIDLGTRLDAQRSRRRTWARAVRDSGVHTAPTYTWNPA